MNSRAFRQEFRAIDGKPQNESCVTSKDRFNDTKFHDFALCISNRNISGKLYPSNRLAISDSKSNGSYDCDSKSLA